MRKIKKPSMLTALFISIVMVSVIIALVDVVISKDKKYDLLISNNIKNIDFINLVEEIKNVAKPEDDKLYPVNRSLRLEVDKEGNIENFTLDFLVFINNKPVHYQTTIIKTEPMKLRISESWKIERDKNELVNKKELGKTICLLERIPWGHLEKGLYSKDYDVLGISNFTTGDGRGNIRVDIATNETRAFTVEENDNISEFSESTVVPYSDYYVLSFSPITYSSDSSVGSGSLEVQYFFETN